MLSLYEQIKQLEKELKEIEKEYLEKEEELTKKEEEFTNHHLFGDLRSASEYQYGPTIEGYLSLSVEGKYLRDPEFAYAFYQKYAYAYKYASELDSLDENLGSINILGKFIYEDAKEYSPKYYRVNSEDKEPIRPFKEYEYPFSLYTGTPGEYAMAIVALRLAKVNFQELYNLKCECDNRLDYIHEVRKQIAEYKVEVGTAIAKGAAAKTEQAINTIVKPNIDRGIKFLIKKFAQSNNENQE